MPVTSWLARFLQQLVMNFLILKAGIKEMPLEDRIEKLARLALLALLFATLGWIV